GWGAVWRRWARSSRSRNSKAARWLWCSRRAKARPRPAVAKRGCICHNAGLPPPGQGLPWRRYCAPDQHAFLRDGPADRARALVRPQESQMPKLKTKSGVKKRFRLTATGRVISTQAKKRHGMIKRTNKQIRQLRGTTMMSPSDAKIVKKWMPYG